MIRLINELSALVAAGALAATTSYDLKKECARVHEVYPRLMLATMLEGPVDCSDHFKDNVDCAANETPEERAAHARRLAIRQHQENAYKPADAACKAWSQNPESSEMIEAATIAIANARAAETWRPEDNSSERNEQ